MSVSQYIGARYVPLFAEPAEWNAERTYEPLTIVLHEGNSYTSKQFVPKGVPIDDDSFWALTGDYNAQVEQYRNEVKSFDGRITANARAIETETTNLAGAVTAEMKRAQSAERTLQANIDAEKTRAENTDQTLRANIDAEKTRAENADQTLRANIDAEKTRAENAERTLRANIDAEKTRAENAESALNLKKTVMLSFGDSFGDEQGEWPFKLADKFGLKCDSFNIGGDVWPWKKGLQNAISKYNTEDKKSTIAFAVAYGGINQILDEPLTDATVINEFIDSFNAAFPKVRLYIAPMNNCSPHNTNFPKIYENALRSYNPLMNQLRKHDGDFILLSNSIWYNTGVLNSWKDDRLHPNEVGSTLIANNMAMAITGTNTFSQALPVIGEHDGWSIITDSYVADGYIVTCGAVNTKVTTASIYSHIYGITPLLAVSNPELPIPIKCRIYSKSGEFKRNDYVFYKLDRKNPQSYIQCINLTYDSGDVVYILPTMIPLL